MNRQAVTLGSGVGAPRMGMGCQGAVAASAGSSRFHAKQQMHINSERDRLSSCLFTKDSLAFQPKTKIRLFSLLVWQKGLRGRGVCWIYESQQGRCTTRITH